MSAEKHQILVFFRRVCYTIPYMKIRTKPFNWLLEHSPSDRILVVMGARQVGKSTLMKQYKEYQEKK
jgi:predicted AAA+ superfamily ATPase